MLPRFFQAWLLLHLVINRVRHPNKQQGPEEIIDKYPDTLFLFARNLHIALSIFVKLFTLFVVVSG